MSILQVFVIAAFIPMLVNWILRGFSKRDGDDEGSVHMPRALFLTGSIVGFLCLILEVFSIVLQLGMVWDVIIFLISLLALVCFLAYYSVNIRYDRETFCCKKFFHRKIYRYTDINSVIPGSGNDYTLVMETGKVRVDGMAVNGQQFLYYAEERYREAGLGLIPDIPNRFFRGYVVAPLPKIILLCLPGILLAALSVFFTIELFSIKIPENLVNETMMLTFLGEQDETLIFSSGEKNLRIYSDAIMDVSGLGFAVSQNQELNIIYSQTDENTLEIWGISSQGSVYAVPKTVYKAEMKGGKETILIFWMVTICYWGFVIFSFYILSHAERYPWLAALLVKKEDLNI